MMPSDSKGNDILESRTMSKVSNEDPEPSQGVKYSLDSV